MAFTLIFGFIFALIIVSGVAMIAYTAYKTHKRNINYFGVAVAIIGLLGIILIPASFHTVEAGEIAVVKHLGEARVSRTAGTYFDFWITEKYEIYDSKVQNMEISTQAYSKDAQTMMISMTMQYKIDDTKVIDIANQYGTIALLANRLESIATEKAKATLSSYSAMNIIETRSTISPLVEQTIKDAVNEEYCVDIVAVVLTNIDFSDAFEKTVELRETKIIQKVCYEQKPVCVASDGLNVFDDAGGVKGFAKFLETLNTTTRNDVLEEILETPKMFGWTAKEGRLESKL